MKAMEKHVGVKGAALALGVHPQTIRGWTRRGILVGIRLPGSRYRRYALEEIQRVRLHQFSVFGRVHGWEAV